MVASYLEKGGVDQPANFFDYARNRSRIFRVHEFSDERFGDS